MPEKNVILTDHFDRFIASGIESGRFANANEAIGEGLSLLEQSESDDEAKMEWLLAAAKEGTDALDRGDYVTVRSGQEIDDLIDRLAVQAERELAAEAAGV